MDHMSLRGVPYPLVLDSRTASRSTEPKMERRTFLGTVGFSVLAAPLAAHAQQAGKVYRVGVLWFNSLQVDAHLLEAFRRGLREFVGVEERNIVLEFRSAEVNPERLPGLVAELVRLKADVIVADTTVAIRAAMRGTTSIPIVLAIAADPVGSGLVPSLAHPGGNVTGLSLMLPEISAKRLQGSPSEGLTRGCALEPGHTVAHAHAERDRGRPSVVETPGCADQGAGSQRARRGVCHDDEGACRRALRGRYPDVSHQPHAAHRTRGQEPAANPVRTPGIRAGGWFDLVRSESR